MAQKPLLDPAIFEFLGSKIEEENEVSDALAQAVRNINQAVSAVQGLMSRIHSTPRSAYAPLIAKIEDGIKAEITSMATLNQLASRQPYYKYSFKWNRTTQNAIFTVVLCAWLGGMATPEKPGELGRLLSHEEVGVIFDVPTNLNDRDAFHFTIEEYLLALADVTSELARLAVNATTMGDYALPGVIGTFVRDLFAGFQMLNLKNDTLRRRVDGVKYDLKRVEDVVYDLSIRQLAKTGEAADTKGAQATG